VSDVGCQADARLIAIGDLHTIAVVRDRQPCRFDDQFVDAAVGGRRDDRRAAAGLVILGLLSRVLGLVRELLIANFFGISAELDAVFLGLALPMALAGGIGTVLGTVLGVLVIGVLRNGLVLMGVSPFMQEVMIGLVIIIAVAIDKWSMRSRST